MPFKTVPQMKFSFKIYSIAFVAAILFFSLASCNLNSSKDKETADAPLVADTSQSVQLQLVTNAINFPVEMEAAPDDTHRLFIADLSGKIMVSKNGTVLPQPFLDVRSKLEQKDTSSEVRAMFGFTFHPQFASNKKFYVCYNAPALIDTNSCTLVVSEFTVSTENADSAILSSEHRILEIQGHGVDHDACQIAFGPDGYLYVSIGDNHTPLNERKGQDLNSLLGKVLRIDVNKTPYAIPADNPFVGVKNTRPEIWAYGLRRFWRFSFDPQSHVLIGGEVGDKLREEVDIITKGGNYGWPIQEGDTLVVQTSAKETAGFVAPLNTYNREVGICVVGGSFYYGKNLSSLNGKYVFADYNGSLFSLTKNTNGEWARQSLKIVNKPADPLLIISFDKDENNELYILGVLNTKAGFKGAVYKLVKS